MKSDNIFPAIQMTDACNKRCRACLRTPDKKAYKLHYDDFQKYIEDLRRMSRKYRIDYQFVTGGEPTIWKDEGRDIVDIISELSGVDFIVNIVMPTNGRVFENEEFTADFISRLSEKLKRKIIIGLSIADYQENLNDDGSRALDNLLKECGKPGAQAFPIALVTLSREDNTSELLKKMYPNVYQRVTPLAPMGSAEDMRERCPGLSLAGTDKSALGDFLEHFKADVTRKLKIPVNDFDGTPNSIIIDRLSLFNNCGKSPFISDYWNYCLPFMGNESFELCSIGEMEDNILSDFIKKNPALKSIRSQGLLSAVRKFKGRLSEEAWDRIDEILNDPSIIMPVAYRGCIICKELFSTGIMEVQ